MSNSLGNAYVKIRGDLTSLKTDLNKALDQIKGVESAVDKSSKRMEQSFKNFGNVVKTIAVTYISGYLIKSFSDAVRSAEELNNKMKIAVGGADGLGAAYKSLVDMSNRTFTALTDNVSAYQKAVVVLGLSHEQSVSLIETWNKTLKVSGATTQEASAATVQFFQAIASNRLGGDELRSIMEQNSYFAKMLAKELGITTGELRKWGEEGKLSADVVMGAMSRMSESVNKDFGNVSLTINGALTQLDNVFQMIMTSTVSSSNGVKSVAQAISDLAQTIEKNRAGIEAFFARIIDLAGKAAQAVGWIGEAMNKMRISELASEIAAVEQNIRVLSGTNAKLISVDVAGDLLKQQERLAALKREYGVLTGTIQVFKIENENLKKAVDNTNVSHKNHNDTTKDAEKAAKAAAKAAKELAAEYAALGKALAMDTWLGHYESRYEVQSRTIDVLIQQEKEYIEEGKALGEDMWLTHEQGRKDATDRAIEYEIKADEEAAKEIQKIYDEMWNGIQNSFADTIYDMFDEGLDSWGDFFDSILDLFKKMLANMVAAWLVSGLKGLFTGTGSGFSLSGLFGSESSTGDGVLGLGVGGALAAGWDKITSGVSSLASALGLTTKAVSGLASETTVVANGMYEFGAGTTAATTGALALTGALIPLGAALAGSLGLDEVLFGGSRPDAYDMLHEWAAGVRDLTDAELTYYKAAYMSDFTGIDAQAMKDSISLQNEYAAYLGLTVDQMDALVRKRAELDIALRQEAGLLDWFNTALVDKSAETIKFELEELLATFELDPSDEWYKLKIGVDMAGIDPMNLDARASGGPVSANTPYIVGEQGKELFWPTTSGHILNNSDTQRLLAMGIKGYASGTASLPWYEDPATHSSGTTEQEMWESLYASVADFLDLLTDLQKEIEDINKTFEDYITTAEEVGATQEELDDIYEMWSESLQASADDWIKGVKDAIRDTFGLSGGLRDSLSDIRDQFDEWIDDLGTLIENGLDPGTTEAELRALEIASIVQAITDALKDMSQGLRDLQFSIASWVGKVTNTSGDLEDAYYALVYARSQFGSGGIFDFLGLSEADLSEYSQDLEAYFQSVFNTLSSAYESFISQQGTIADKIEDIQVSGMGLADRSIYYAGQLYDKLNQLADLPTDRAEEAVELTSDIYDTLLSYYSAEKEAIEDRYQTEIDAINYTYESMASLVNILESVNQKIKDIKYSSYNLALPTAKAEEAIQDYATLFADAQTMNEDAVSKYLDFIDTYLQAGQDAYKSSTAYLDMYNQVMSDLESLGLSAASVSGKSLEDLTEEQNDLIASLEEAMKQELATLDNTIIESLNILDDMISDEIEDVASLLALLWSGIQDTIDALSTALIGASLGDINDTLYLFMGGVGGFLQTMDENNTANTDRLIAAIMGYGGGGTYTAGMTYAEFYDYMNAFTEQLGQALYTLDTNQAARDATTQSLLTDLKNVTTTMSGKLSYYDPSSGTTFSNAALNFASYYAQRDLNKALGVPGYAEGGVASGPTSGYPVTLHGVEAVVPLASGAIPVRFTGSSMDEETKTLLRELVSVSKSKQRCEIVLDSGERLSGYIRKEADVVRVSANERQGVSRRRLY